jgi:hypothetical protein
MVKSEKKLKELASFLGSKDDAAVTQSVEMLRENEPFEGAVSLLADYYDKNTSPAPRKAIEGFMNDIKDKDLRSEVITEIKKPRSSSTVGMLVSSCWQSGLDYSAFSTDIAEVFMKGDYSVALECFTVIEESLPQLSRTQKNRIIELIEENPLPDSDSKKLLTLELITLMES